METSENEPQIPLTAEEFDPSAMTEEEYVNNVLSKFALAVCVHCFREGVPGAMASQVVIEYLMAYKAIDETFLRLMHQAVAERSSTKVNNILTQIGNAAYGLPPKIVKPSLIVDSRQVKGVPQ